MSHTERKMVSVYASPEDLLDIMHELNEEGLEDQYNIFVQKDRSITIIYKHGKDLAHPIVTQTILDAEIDARVEVYLAEVSEDGSYRPDITPAYTLHYDKTVGLVKKEKHVEIHTNN